MLIAKSKAGLSIKKFARIKKIGRKKKNRTKTKMEGKLQSVLVL